MRRASLSHQEAVAVWLTSMESRVLPAERLLSGVCERLVDRGVPLWRVVTSLRPKHPDVFARNFRWHIGEGCMVESRSHGLIETPAFQDSPVKAIFEGAGAIRCKLTGPDADLRYPVCRELAAEGATDYLVCPVELAFERTFLSWCTKAEGGFTDEHLWEIGAITEPLALRLALENERYTTRCLLEVYLGRNAAQRVLSGSFKRGGGEAIECAIWFCDMRGFTEMADRMPASEVVRTLDRFFETVAGPIEAHGGEILKFIGDAVLAIFPLSTDAARFPSLRPPEAAPDPRRSERPPAPRVHTSAAEICAGALDAARAALEALDELNEDRRDRPIGLGIALHTGEVMYGNIGARDRLDFTVIGAAVNEVTRVESMCKPLGARLLLTRAFVRTWGGSATSVGKHALKGVSEPQELFTLDNEARDF